MARMHEGYFFLSVIHCSYRRSIRGSHQESYSDRDPMPTRPARAAATVVDRGQSPTFPAGLVWLSLERRT